MATAKTGSFYLNETVILPAGSAAGTRFQSTLDLSAYVNVPTGQAIAVTDVDFIWQTGPDFGQDIENMVTSNGTLGVQLTDLNPGTVFIRADGQSLIASGALNIDQANNISSNFNDIYPDNFGPANLSESFMVVNDTLYLVGGVDGAAIHATFDVACTVRVRCQVVKLSSKDWMSIAIQSTAES